MYNYRSRCRRSPTTVLRYADYRCLRGTETPDSGYGGSADTLDQDDFYEIDEKPDIIEGLLLSDIKVMFRIQRVSDNSI